VAEDQGQDAAVADDVAVRARRLGQLADFEAGEVFSVFHRFV